MKSDFQHHSSLQSNPRGNRKAQNYWINKIAQGADAGPKGTGKVPTSEPNKHVSSQGATAKGQLSTLSPRCQCWTKGKWQHLKNHTYKTFVIKIGRSKPKGGNRTGKREIQLKTG